MKRIENETYRNQEMIIERLAQYRTYQTMLALRDQLMRTDSRVLIAMRIRELEREVRSLPVGRERLLLELHYFEGHSIERCAELMYISRATAYRVHRRALDALIAQNRQRTMHA